MKKQRGFSLVELLVYIGIFTAVSVFLVGIFIIFTRVNIHQTSINEVNDQISFVNNTIQRVIRESSLVSMPVGTATTTIELRMASSTLDPTRVYLEDNAIYLEEGSFSPISLTDSHVVVDNFLATEYENPGGNSIVQIYMTVSYNTSNEQAKFKRTFRTAISRASAATFDSDVLPDADDSRDIGNASQNWKDAYFSGDVGVGGNIGIGISPAVGISLKVIGDTEVTGDIFITSSTQGLIGKSPDGICHRSSFTNSGSTTSTVVDCP